MVHTMNSMPTCTVRARPMALTAVVIEVALLGLGVSAVARADDATYAYPLPISVESKYFLPSGVYLQVSGTVFDDPPRALPQERLRDAAPKAALAEVLRCVRDTDSKAFARLLDDADAFDPSAVLKILSAVFPEPRNVVIEEEISVGGVNVFIVKGASTATGRMLIPIARQGDRLVFTWSLSGHPIFQILPELIRARLEKPGDYERQPSVPGAHRLVIEDPFDIGSPDSVSFLVVGSKLSFPIVGVDHEPTRVPDHVSRSVLAFYRSSYDALRSKDREAYMNTLDAKSRQRAVKNWEQAEAKDALDPWIEGRSRSLRIVGVIASGRLTILCKEGGRGRYDMIVEQVGGGYERVNVGFSGPLEHLLNWNKFRDLLPAGLVSAAPDK